ncbi:uncharacterized protein LOC111302759 [Durio zibethinus]|uniref:Uncharacterized protein LOC111302759 n=1 Tax=Durio zibethinus TaxID=66656 RepID=A0A6P5ZNA8_DURZI|nr:uncharacterized protein LOC111302759 [Durio zibethinus]
MELLKPSYPKWAIDETSAEKLMNDDQVTGDKICFEMASIEKLMNDDQVTEHEIYFEMLNKGRIFHDIIDIRITCNMLASLLECYSSANQNSPLFSFYLPPLSWPPPPTSSHHQHLHFSPSSRTDSLSYSPPRELFQIIVDFGRALNSNGIFAKCATFSTLVQLVYGSENIKDFEIECLKKELGHVSKQQENLERECSQLKKERNKKD